jgi:hypothetical protein
MIKSFNLVQSNLSVTKGSKYAQKLVIIHKNPVYYYLHIFFSLWVCLVTKK